MPDCVQKVMMILRELSDAVGRPVPLAVLSERTGIHKSTLSHILKDLCDEHYVVRVSHTEGYVLGPETYLLTRYGRYGKDIIHECHPILRYINKEIGGTAVFAVVKSNVKYIIDRIADEGVYKDEGADLLVDDLYRTVTGRVILANIPLVDALDIWERNGLPTPKTTGRRSRTAAVLRTI